MAKATAKTLAKVVRKPVKAGSSMRKNVGGIINPKIIAVVKNKKKNG